MSRYSASELVRTGYRWLGEWSGAVNYYSGDAVVSGTSSYICVASNTNQEPSVTPSAWDLTSVSGDVSGPDLSVDNHLPLFDGETGKLIKDSGGAVTAAGLALLDDATVADQRTTLELGTAAQADLGSSAGEAAEGDHDHAAAYQPLDSDLTAVAALSSTGIIERTGDGTAGVVTITAAGKALLDDADADAQRTTLELGTVAVEDTGILEGQVIKLIAGGKLPASVIPDGVAGGLTFTAVWNAGNAFPGGTAAAANKGNFYKVSVAGSTDVGGETDWAVGDIVLSDGASWIKLDQSELAMAAATSGAAGAAGNVPQPQAGDEGKFLRGDATWADVTLPSDMGGDSGSGGTAGLVPAQAAGDAAANKFLHADGTWTAVAAGNPFDQDLNTTDDVTFNTVAIGESTSGSAVEQNATHSTFIDATTGFEVSTLTEAGASEASYKAFTSTGGWFSYVDDPTWLQYRFTGTTRYITQFDFTAVANAGHYNATRMQLLGSNTGAFAGEESILYDEVDVFVEGTQSIEDVTNPGNYEYYRFHFSEFDGTTRVGATRIHLLGFEAGGGLLIEQPATSDGTTALLDNGTWGAVGSNPFDQDLNTTNDVDFNTVRLGAAGAVAAPLTGTHSTDVPTDPVTGFTTSSSGHYLNTASLGPWQCFDKTTAAWNGDDVPLATTPAWIQYQFNTTQKYVTSYEVTPSNASVSPSGWELQGSNSGNFAGTEGVDYFLLDTKTGITPEVGVTTTHTVTTPGLYEYYRFHMTEQPVNNQPALRELEFIGFDSAPGITIEAPAASAGATVLADNGTWVSLGAAFDQDLNTTDDVQFNTVQIGSASGTPIDTVPTLTADDSSPLVGEAFSTTPYSATEAAWYVFDGTNAASQFQSGVWAGYWGFKFVEKQVLTAYEVTPKAYSRPEDFTFEGSNDTTDGSDGTWVTLDTVTGHVSVADTTDTFPLSGSTGYFAYRLNVSSFVNGNTSGALEELQFVGYQSAGALVVSAPASSTGATALLDNGTWGSVGNEMTGDSGAGDGTGGFVPAPDTAGDNARFLKGDGTWADLSGLAYLGTWNAATNTPALTNGSGADASYYRVSDAGTTAIDGISDWGVADWVISNGTVWQKLDNSEVAAVEMTGDSGAGDGTGGLVPAPDTAGDNVKFLRGDGTWTAPSNIFDQDLNTTDDVQFNTVQVGVDSPATLATDSHTTFVAASGTSSSSGYINNYDWKAFDGSTLTDWQSQSSCFDGSGNPTEPVWIQYEFNEAKTITAYDVFDNGATASPLEWTLYGSNTGAFGGEEVAVDVATGGSEGSSWANYTVDNPGEYLFYRMDITKNGGYHAVSMKELALLASPGGSWILTSPSAGDTTKFLRGDGVWATAAGNPFDQDLNEADDVTFNSVQVGIDAPPVVGSLVPVLTSNSSSSEGTASQSSAWGASEAWRAFDGVDSDATVAQFADGTFIGWWAWEFANDPMVIKQYKIKPYPSNWGSMLDFNLEGSDDGFNSHVDILDAQVGYTWANDDIVTFDVVNSTAYQAYRIRCVTPTNGTQEPAIRIFEFLGQAASSALVITAPATSEGTTFLRDDGTWAAAYDQSLNTTDDVQFSSVTVGGGASIEKQATHTADTDATTGYIISASGTAAGYSDGPWEAVNGITSDARDDGWVGPNVAINANPQWLQYQFTNDPKVIAEYSLVSSGEHTAPTEFQLLGSNNGNFAGTLGVDYFLLDDVTAGDAVTYDGQTPLVFTIDTPGSYEYYRMAITNGEQPTNWVTLIAWTLSIIPAVIIEAPATFAGTTVLADNGQWIGMAGGIVEIIVDQADMMDDSTLIGQSSGVYGQVMSCKDFGPDDDGATYFHLKSLDAWDLDADILFKVYYSLDGVDNSKVARLITDYWVINDDGSAPVVGTPDGTGTDDITSSADNTTKMDIMTLTNGKIANADMTTADSMVAVRIQRQAENAADTYTGTFKLLKVVAYQA